MGLRGVAHSIQTDNRLADYIYHSSIYIYVHSRTSVAPLAGVACLINKLIGLFSQHAVRLLFYWILFHWISLELVPGLNRTFLFCFMRLLQFFFAFTLLCFLVLSWFMPEDLFKWYPQISISAELRKIISSYFNLKLFLFHWWLYI